MHSLILTKEQLQNMIDYVQSQVPFEACGLLAGRDSKVEKMIEIQNQAGSPTRFVMNPIEQLNAFKWIESNDMELLGIFHSHPTGPETVSATDVQEANYPVVNVILTPVDSVWHARGFWIENGEFEEVLLDVE